MITKHLEPARMCGVQVEFFGEAFAKECGFGAGDSIEALVGSIGGEIRYRDILASEQALTDASLVIEAPRRFRIILPNHTTHARDRLEIAKELGRYFLLFLLPYLQACPQDHEPFQSIRLERYPDRETQQQCNQFAAAFLMPAGVFKEASDRFGGNTQALADHFGVPGTTVFHRQVGLGLIQRDRPQAMRPH